MPECSNCGIELEFDDTVDQFGDSDIVIFYEVGHCPCCGKSFKWEDRYEFTNYSNLEEN